VPRKTYAVEITAFFLVIRELQQLGWSCWPSYRPQEQVQQVRSIIEGLGLAPATPEEAREILDLKDADLVAF